MGRLVVFREWGVLVTDNAENTMINQLEMLALYNGIENLYKMLLTSDFGPKEFSDVRSVISVASSQEEEDVQLLEAT